jgi:hypothetical protein
VQPLLEGIEYHPSGALDLSVGVGVGDWDILDVDPTILIVLPELVVVEVGTQVCDDTTGSP